MQLRSTKIAVALTAFLACSLVTSTTFAYYRVSVGAKRCCTSHCRHAMPKRAAEHCCRTHPDAAPAATSTIASPDVAAPVLFVAGIAPVAGLPGIPPPRSESRPPPARSLLGQRTSLSL